ncbi:unnamed protein product [Macrosiphum euphorbiae]|uniref:Transposase domain-containing protein n=1 Tax=Macrosiphum euphorbiae TaxID=13131 RepID=A0AAV0W7G8_9HEMI|nr:unnamed protein product [Macrosiphum euphorbiae]
MASFYKNTNLSKRTKQRRVEEELKSSTVGCSSKEYNTENIGPTLVESSFSNIDHSAPSITSQSKSNDINLNIDVLNSNGDEELYYSSDGVSSSETDENEWNENYDNPIDNLSHFKFLIMNWAIDCNIPQIALNKLLTLLKKHKCFEDLPKDSRTIMSKNIEKSSEIQTVVPGKYYHFGILKGIEQNFTESVQDDNKIEIIVGIDGLPLYKSNPEQLWPILAYIRPDSTNVFPIGIYCGREKPASSNDFMKLFVDEAKFLYQNGICIKNKTYNFSVYTLCCDVPAKSFVLQIKGHSGFFSCTRCEVEGEYLNNRICFPYNSPLNRPQNITHQNYLLQSKEEHHVGDVSIITTLPNFNVVTSFSLDYMHLVCLGVVRKLILLWIKGPINIRYPSWKIKEISNSLENLKNKMPCEFARKPRRLDEICRWKATEFRTFVLYIGTFVTKSVLKKEHWKHFFSLNLAMMILISPDYGQYINHARLLLDNFVKNFELMYGRHLISHNIHGLIHLCDDYTLFGPLDNVSAFPFENYMGSLKKMLRKPDKPLQQIIKRYKEKCLLMSNTKYKYIELHFTGIHNRGPIIENSMKGLQFSSLKLENMTVKTKVDADSYLITKDKKLIKVVNIISNERKSDGILICKYFQNSYPLFLNPISSIDFDIYAVNNLSSELIWYHINDINKKIILIPHNNEQILLPLLHSTKNSIPVLDNNI